MEMPALVALCCEEGKESAINLLDSSWNEDYLKISSLNSYVSYLSAVLSFPLTSSLSPSR